MSVRVGPPYGVLRDVDPHAATRDLGTTLQAMLDDLQRRPEHQPAVGEPVPWHPAHLGGGAPTPQAAQQIENGRHAVETLRNAWAEAPSLRTGRPLSDYVDVEDGATDGSVATVSLSLVDGVRPDIVLQLLNQREAVFVSR